MSFFDETDRYLYEQNLTDFPCYPFSVPDSLLQFLETPINYNDGSVSIHRKRIGSTSECAKQAKYLCTQLLDEVDNDLEMIEDGVNAEVNRERVDVNKRLRQKLKNEHQLHVKKAENLEERHRIEVEKLARDLEQRKEALLSEMLSSLERQREAIVGKLKSGKTNGDNLMACTGNADNGGQVLTRKLRRKANAEAAACHVSPEIDPTLGNISVVNTFLSTTNENHVQLDDSMVETSVLTATHSGLLDHEQEEDATVKYEEVARMKGPGNSITLTGNGFRADSLLAKLDVRLTDDEVLKDLMIVTKGKYKASNIPNAGNSGGVNNQTKTTNVISESKGFSGVHHSDALPYNCSNQKLNHVYLEDKHLVYNSTTFSKGQHVLIEGNWRGVCTILAINQTELQLKKLNDSTKIKLSLDMLRRGTYRLSER